MQIKYWKHVERAWNIMVAELFKPFNIEKWFTIGFAAFLAGSTLSGGSYNSGGGSNFSNSEKKKNSSRTTQTCPIEKGDTYTLATFADEFSENSESTLTTEESAPGFQCEDLGISPAMLTGLIAVVSFAFILAIIFVWIQSRGKFMFLDNVLFNRGAIKSTWAKYREQGNSLFLWQLLIGFISMILAAIILAPFILSLIKQPDQFESGDFASIFLSLLPMVFCFFALVLVLGFFQALIEHFIIPLMLKHECVFADAWRRLTPLLRGTGVFRFILYGLMLWLVRVALSVALIMVVLGSCCVLLIPLVIPYIGTVFQLPFFVLLRLVGPSFLAQFGEEYDLLSSTPAQSLLTAPTLDNEVPM